MPEVWRQQLNVSFDYDVYFTDNALSVDNDVLVKAVSSRQPADTVHRHRFVAVIDDGVARAWPQLGDAIERYAQTHSSHLQLLTAPLVVAGGEDAKNGLKQVEQVWCFLDEHGVDRHAFVVAIGGGAMLDAVGFAAASAHRGVRLVRMPTTVLGQADSGVGVKNGINAHGKKNLIGAFAPPHAVIVDTAFLSTLSTRDCIAGMPEAVKVALIRDAGFFDWLETQCAKLAQCDALCTAELVRRCAGLHMHHIANCGDPFEMGSARPLDFGHWAAHKLESLTNHALRHGEAVAIGLALDTIYSAKVGKCSPDVPKRVCALLRGLGLRLWDPELARTNADGQLVVLDGLEEFREHLGGELTVTLLEGIGRGVEVHEMNRNIIAEAISELHEESA